MAPASKAQVICYNYYSVLVMAPASKMVHIVVVHTDMAYTLVACVVMAHIAMAYDVNAYACMADIGMDQIVLAGGDQVEG